MRINGGFSQVWLIRITHEIDPAFWKAGPRASTSSVANFAQTVGVHLVNAVRIALLRDIRYEQRGW